MDKKDDKKKKDSSSDESLENFDIRINEFGEIITNYDIDNLNAFLNDRVEDKKLKSSDDIEEESSDEEE